MVSHLTNNETYFYREMPQLQVFAEHVLREIKERKAARATAHAAHPLRRLLDGRGGATPWP